MFSLYKVHIDFNFQRKGKEKKINSTKKRSRAKTFAKSHKGTHTIYVKCVKIATLSVIHWIFQKVLYAFANYANLIKFLSLSLDHFSILDMCSFFWFFFCFFFFFPGLFCIAFLLFPQFGSSNNITTSIQHLARWTKYTGRTITTKSKVWYIQNLTLASNVKCFDLIPLNISKHLLKADQSTLWKNHWNKNQHIVLYKFCHNIKYHWTFWITRKSFFFF